ncbi:unnamed protein product [Brassicogethes aeneus]|uniref:Uncharacterized protein n=1 Tax=Brassicogethes aeneus TaxID=1431903 RepID=A0A9P0ATD9_BRAAE|nr:unnamed protein product [Brassicogethes aeneus]
MEESIMSGDSPNAHKNEIFDFSKEGRSSPVPTTSKDAAVQISNPAPAAAAGIVQTSVAVEPEKRVKEEEPLDICCPTLNESDDLKRQDSEEGLKFDDRDDSDEKDKKANGGDKLDGVWVPTAKKDKPRQDEEMDDNCVVKCLYYTLQCYDSDEKDKKANGGDKLDGVWVPTAKKDKPRQDEEMDDNCDKKANGGDKLDGVWVPTAKKDKPRQDEEMDDNCVVKCLYYTLQCCECNIM